MRQFSKHIALFCLLLTFWTAYAYVAHHHSNATDSAKCVVCVAAHSAAPKAVSGLTVATFTFVSAYRPEPVSSKQCVLAFALRVRPPPSV